MSITRYSVCVCFSFTSPSCRHTGISLKLRETSCWSRKWSESPARYEPSAAWPKKNLPVSNCSKTAGYKSGCRKYWWIHKRMQSEWFISTLCVSVWAVCSPSQAQVLLQFGSAVWTLSRISNLHLYCPHGADDLLSTHSAPPPPEGSLLGVVDHTCQLHLHVQVCSHFLLSRMKRD